MPYVYDPNLEDEENQDGGGFGNVQISGASPTTDSEGNDSANSAPKKEGISTGSGFQNLDSYLNTNQSKEFGQQVLGKVGQEVESAKQNQTSAADQFKQQVSDSSKVPTTDQVNSAIANPTGADKKAFQEWQSQTYQGPKSLAESPDTWNQYWSGSNKANTSAQLLGSEPGRFALLDSYFGRPSYNFGEKSLDNLLVQQSGLGKQTRDLQNQAALLKSQGETQSKDLQSLASQGIGEVDRSRQAVRGAIGLDDQGNVITGDKAGAIGQQYKGVEDELAAANAARAKEIADLKGNLTSGSLSTDQLQQIGLSSGQNIYNLDLNSYLTPGSELNRNQTMTPEQRAYIQALSELAGVSDTFASGQAQEKSNPFTFDNSRFNTDANSLKSSYTSAIENAYSNASKMGPVTLTPSVYTPERMQSLLAANQKTINENPGSPNNEERQRFVNQLSAALNALSSINSQYTPDRKLTDSSRASIAKPRIGGGGSFPVR